MKIEKLFKKLQNSFVVKSTTTGGNTNFFLGGDSRKKCDHCDQSLIKVAGNLYRVYIYYWVDALATLG